MTELIGEVLRPNGTWGMFAQLVPGTRPGSMADHDTGDVTYFFCTRDEAVIFRTPETGMLSPDRTLRAVTLDGRTTVLAVLRPGEDYETEVAGSTSGTLRRVRFRVVP